MLKWLKNAIKQIKNRSKPIKIKLNDEQIQTFGTIAGFFMLFIGLWLISPSWALIPCGLFVMWVFWPGKG